MAQQIKWISWSTGKKKPQLAEDVYLKTPSRRWPTWGVLVFLILLKAIVWPATSRAAEAVSTEPAQPLHFWADSSTIFTQENRAELKGHVKVQQGQTTATAQRMVIFFREEDTGPSDAEINLNRIEKIELHDQVHIEFDNNVAEGQSAVYFADQRKLVLSGPGTKIISGQNEMNCSTIVYLRNEGRMECTSDGQGQVKARIHTSGSGLN